MKKIKGIFFSVFLLFSIAQISGQDILRYYDQPDYAVENNCPPQENKSCITAESAIEEEPTVICCSNLNETILPLKESHLNYDYELPVKLYYSIWLPPEIS